MPRKYLRTVIECYPPDVTKQIVNKREITLCTSDVLYTNIFFVKLYLDHRWTMDTAIFHDAHTRKTITFREEISSTLNAIHLPIYLSTYQCIDLSTDF